MTDRTPLTVHQLAEIEARATAATAGPWGVYTFGGGNLIEIAADLEDTGCGYRARRTIARLEDEPLDNDPAHREWTAEEDWAQVQADAQFVAHAPADVRALLDEITRLKDQRKYLIGQLAKRDAESGRGDEAVRQFLAGEQPAGDPLAYGPTGIPCGCGKAAHSNLVPCQPDEQPAVEGEQR
ncbi:hypothetical protein ACWERY_02320 [Streptomyces sp. NPDC004082]